MEKEKKYYSGKSGVVNEFEYLCVHPINPNYHILINSGNMEPIRMYQDDFDQLRPTERDAVQQAIHCQESSIKSLKEWHAEILDDTE